jgi:hypothetical protein
MLSALLLAGAIAAPSVRADDPDLGPWALSVFGGPGSRLDATGTLEHLPDYETTDDRLVAVALSRRLAWIADALSLDGELMGAHHYGDERYQEIGLGMYLHWHDFPWNDRLRTTFGIGIGPTYTTTYPTLEFGPGEAHRSRILNQFNPELTFALPSEPQTSLLLRLQHRSGIFGLINGVWDSSNYLTVGLREQF